MVDHEHFFGILPTWFFVIRFGNSFVHAQHRFSNDTLLHVEYRKRVKITDHFDYPQIDLHRSEKNTLITCIPKFQRGTGSL